MDRKLLEQIISESYDAVLVTDREGIIILANQATLDSFHLTLPEIIGKTPWQLIEKGFYTNSSIIKALQTGRTATELITLPDHRRFSTSVPLLDENGEISMVLTNSRSEEVLIDFSRRLAYEQEQHTRYKEIADYLSTIRTDEPVYRSRQMEEIMSVCAMVADTDSTVMLLGESGVGKEVLAKAIHSMSARREYSFIPINCAAIPHELFESELFGYAPHAFTGASAKGRMGLIRMAHKGTLFLDEVAELPLTMQTKLLRFLSTGEITPVGSSTPELVDIRIITATNQDLLAMAKEKRFRLDLYYRLNVIPIQVPPLRDRPEDIDVLSLFFLEGFNKKYKKSISLDHDDQRALLDYDWPGNVRELRNVIERMVVMSKSVSARQILYPTLPVPNAETAPPRGGQGEDFQVPLDIPLREALEQFEAYYVNAVLARHEGALGEAARTLDIHRTTLYRKQRPGGLSNQL